MSLDGLVQLLPLVLIFIVFYFLLIRPQQKKMRTHQAMLNALRRGDRVVTNGGLIGIVSRITDEQEVQLEIAENVKVRVMRQMISDVMAKGAPLIADESASKVSPKTRVTDKKSRAQPANRARTSKK